MGLMDLCRHENNGEPKAIELTPGPVVINQPRGTQLPTNGCEPRDQWQQIQELQHRTKVLTAENEELKKKIDKLNKENSDWLLRYSAVASAKLRDDNPNIADLSDENRPTKLSEKYSELYDNEWTDAFEELIKAKRTDKEAVDILLMILKTAFYKCQEIAKHDLDNITKAVCSFERSRCPSMDIIKTLKEHRKMHFICNVEEIEKELADELKEHFTENDSSLWKYFKTTTRLCWLMAIQDPPLSIDNRDITNSPFEPDVYKHYLKSGNDVKYVVWPALYFHKGGAILYKGVAQGMDAEITHF